MKGVVGQNCDRCPDGWVLVVNDTRTEVPEWKKHFDYTEGCFPCSSCVTDVLSKAETMENDLAPAMADFSGVNSSYFTFRRLDYIEKEVNRLRPRIELLDPQKSLKRITPLEDQISAQQKNVKGLNVDFKLSLMEKLKNQTKELEESGRNAQQEMNTVQMKIQKITDEMKTIADGLGGSVNQNQIDAFVAAAEQYLGEIVSRNFSDDRSQCREKYELSKEFLQKAKDFSAPGDDLYKSVEETARQLDEMGERLDDLKMNAEKAKSLSEMASQLNFKNSASRATFIVDQIESFSRDAVENNWKGTGMMNKAKTFKDEAKFAFDLLDSENQEMSTMMGKMREEINKGQEQLGESVTLTENARLHANNLKDKADELKDILENVKTPARDVLVAASAYKNIADNINNADEAALAAKTDSDNAASMSVGLKDKADKAMDKTNELYEMATNQLNELVNVLQPSLNTSKMQIENIDMKNRKTKEDVEDSNKKLSSIAELGNKLEVIKDNATDAYDLARNSFVSIQPMAREIHAKLNETTTLQADQAEMKFAMDATKEALNELETRRAKRSPQNDDFNERIERLMAKKASFERKRMENAKLMENLKSNHRRVRAKLAE